MFLLLLNVILKNFVYESNLVQHSFHVRTVEQESVVMEKTAGVFEALIRTYILAPKQQHKTCMATQPNSDKLIITVNSQQ